MLCVCPAEAALPDIPVVDCFESFGQIQKVAFQRILTSTGARNAFTSSSSILTLASWTPKLVAADGTKIVVSPYIQAPDAPAGAAREFGGGNETLGGVVEIIGSEPTNFTGVFRKIPQAVIKEVKKLACERIGVFLFDENGAIGAIKGGTEEAPLYYPIPIHAFHVSDKTLGGYEAPDSNNVRWSFLPNWSDDLVRLAPSFDPLNYLVPA